MVRKIPFSVLDTCPVLSGETPREALQHSSDLACHAEALGYHRYWLTEHHGASSACAATTIVIGHIAGQTSRIRLGAGGIMLPIHLPFVIAEQFGTLASLYPGRIDLGLGRSTGSEPGNEDMLRALRTGPEARARFSSDVRELQSYFREEPEQPVQAMPGAGLDIPLWLLGSSTFSAEEAAKLGLPFAFSTAIASSPDTLIAALDIYRSNFEPSAALDRPYVMVCALVFAAETDKEAQYHLTSFQQNLIGMVLRKGMQPLPPPVDDISALASAEVLATADQLFSSRMVGSRATVHRAIDGLLATTMADELIVVTMMHDQDALRRSFTIVAEHEAFEPSA